MKVTGFTIIRNAIKYDYPVLEAIQSVLPVCDEFIVSVGKSDDDTLALIKSIPSEKIKIMETVWDDSKRVGGLVLSDETNKVLDTIEKDTDWCFYIQSDECIHEDDLKIIREAMESNNNNKEVQGLLFGYKHFYGHYKYVGIGRRWYSNEIRIVRNDKNIRSYKDAQGFRLKNGNKLKVKKVNAFIYHYGWVKPPKAQQAKQESFHKMWHDDEWMKKNIKATEEFDYSNIDFLELYKGTHPKVYAKRIADANWNFIYDKSKIKVSLKHRILFFIEKTFGWRIGENKNYILLKD
ncbi:MAG: glycosyltransferase family 2 protein [Bacteroidia bacterium]|nr:glycosyltransferase family 2 protein [Bacteroidia bacterium]